MPDSGALKLPGLTRKSKTKSGEVWSEQLFFVHLQTEISRGKVARVVEWVGLENRCTGNCTQGSNP